MGFAELVAAADRAAQRLLGGETITYAPAVGSPVPVTGLFDSQFDLAKGDAQAGVETVGPAVFFRVEDLPVDPTTDDPILTIRGLTYRVTERKPDDMGGIVLLVRRDI